jgi:hypothetical protein
VGVIGEYIGRIYNEAKGRPAWVVGRYRNLSGGAIESAGPLHDERDSA